MSYTITGGMWAVTLTDFVQLGILSIGLLLFIPILFEVKQLGEQFSFELHNLLPTSSESSDWLSFSGQLILTGLGAIMGQDLIQRFLSCKDARTARNSAFVSSVCYLVLGIIPLMIGIAGRSLYPHLDNPDTLMLRLAQDYFSPTLLALFATGLISAIMSTADSYLLAGSSLMTHNVMLRIFPAKTPRRELWTLRVVGLSLSLLALILALYVQAIYQLLVHSGAMLAVAIFFPVTFALYSKRATTSTAWSSILLGIAGWGG